MTAPHLIDMFNDAAQLAREGSHEKALQAWDRILTHPEIQPGSTPDTVSGDFLGQSNLRKAWSLMDLGRFIEAKEIFDSDLLKGSLDQFELKVLFDYFFSFANTLGEIGDIISMDDKFSRALNIAADEGDAHNAQLCWLNLMHYAELKCAWEYLERESRACIQFADNSDLPRLALAAGLKRATAQLHLGQPEKATRQTERILAFARELGEVEAISAAEQLLKQLEQLGN
ncbi:MAG: hypothetical protein K2X93_04050 [Candidatus Obscuribacterales bacterium]|nr:hypothetical protein [Candidatus Obscuribacterales bacterium]